MPTFTQAERPLAIVTPLGEDVLLLAALRGSEGISRLFRYEVDLLAELDAEVPFHRLLGAEMTVEMRLADGSSRYFNGLVNRFSQGERNDLFVRYRAELVPQLWLLTRKVRCRIFQQMAIPDILRQVFAGLLVTYDLAGVYDPRDYCVQYRESDFDFASRLMEEEGIYYFFQHSAGKHQLIVTDIAHQHPAVPGQSSVAYEEETSTVRDDMRITHWEKIQELRSGQYTLWDYCFEMPSTRLEAHAESNDTVTVGTVVHQLRVGGNENLEIYDYPGRYAQRFDGVAPHGALRPHDLTQLFPDGDRTVRLRLEQEQAAGLEIRGQGDCANFVPGHKFTLERHFDGNGAYVLTGVEHEARQTPFRSGDDLEFHYENRFTCIPADLRYRPPGVTAKPVIAGVQTARVVGPEGQEIFCDPYGRIKVQFPWDREGKQDANSSCWLRVSQIWAGNRWGAFFWPRIGHEVVVAFEDGDPDRPIVVGSVYNAENMPPMHLPAANMFCGIKSSSLRGKANENFNGLTFVDVKDHEHLALHSERHMVLMAEYDVAQHNGRHHFQRVPGAHMVSVGSVPGIGGSGGGPPSRPGGGSGGFPATTATGTASGTPWAVPQPSSIAGLSSSVVYGTAFTSSWPISLQLANGSLMKVVVDPAGFVEAFPDSSAGLVIATMPSAMILPQGATGNVQLTLGNVISLAVGRVYDVQIGPEKVPIHTNGKSGPGVICPSLATALGLIGILFQISYALIGAPTDHQLADDLRGILVMAFQVTTQVLLACFLSSTVAHIITDIQQKLLHNGVHMIQGVDFTQEITDEMHRLQDFQPTLGAQIIFPGLVIPVLLDSISEISLSQAKDAGDSSSL